MSSVLIVDDSSLIRKILSETINRDPNFDVIGCARDGAEALKKIKEFNPDIITVDINMPHLDGIALINELMKENPKPVLVVSELTKEDSEITFKALESGAVDVLLKPKNINDKKEFLYFKEDLFLKLKASLKAHPKEFSKKGKKPTHHFEKISKKILIIGASTGGPSTLQKLFSEMPGNLPFSILVVQHMPEGFTKAFAQMLDKKSELHIKEAADGDLLRDNTVYICPAGYNMSVIEKEKDIPSIKLTQDEKLHNLRPTVDYLVSSAVPVFGDRIILVVLTGMGYDGTKGAEMVKKNKGRVIVESEESCIIYGMPKSIVEKNLADSVVSLDKLPVAIFNEIEN
ncbi:MAG: protein-glutamate methylesterase/protein-glutamine glutaminase [Nanoarchaeota archaeon]